MSRCIKPQELKDYSEKYIPIILGKLTLFELDLVYRYYTDVLNRSGSAVTKGRFGYGTARAKRESERLYGQLMSNMSFSEKVLYYVGQECIVRRVEERFFS